MADAPRSRTLAIESPEGGGDIAYLDFGPSERPVDAVFLHANGFNAGAYRSILGPLAATLRILAPDLRGHGATALPIAPEGRKTWIDLRGDLIAFLDGLEIGAAVLSGHSMGGTLGLLAAADFPDRVKALALFDPVVLPPGFGLTGELRESPLVSGAGKRRRAFDSRAAAVEAYRGRGGFATWPDEMLEDYVAAGFKDRAGGGVEIACAPEWEVSNYLAQAHDSWAAFEQSRCGVRIWRAEHNSTCQVDTRLEALTASGRIRIETVPGTTHFLPMERPDVVQAGLKAVIGGL
jgi:pimeloyl-ACP methyl ester carboxylesterase